MAALSMAVKASRAPPHPPIPEYGKAAAALHPGTHQSRPQLVPCLHTAITSKRIKVNGSEGTFSNSLGSAT